MKQPATLIFDIGKTAKKVLVFDSHFHVIEEKVEHFTEIVDEDGFPCENLTMVSDWVNAMLDHYLSHSAYTITHVNFSAYGASFVHLDSNDKPIATFYNYLKQFPESSKTEFLRSYNSGQSISAITASPWLGMLNSGLQLYWLKQKKEAVFKTIRTSLHLPQYFAFLVSGKKFCELTSVGCHTMLWDFQRNAYHEWVDKEGLTSLFPEMKLSSHSITTTYKGNDIRLGVGVHDSSAALMPYVVTQHEPFLLLSTGTWNITFNPFNEEPLTRHELEKDCLSYITFEGKPVKASRIFLGHEYEMQVRDMMAAFQASPDFHVNILFDETIYNRLSKSFNTDKVIHAVGMEGSGPMPEKVTQKTNWNAFGSREEAYHQMVRYLVRWQLLSSNLVNPENTVKHMIVVGGFTKNAVFLETLKRESKHLTIYLSDHPRAAALGAAWLVHGKDAYHDHRELLKIVRL